MKRGRSAVRNITLNDEVTVKVVNIWDLCTGRLRRCVRHALKFLACTVEYSELVLRHCHIDAPLLIHFPVPLSPHSSPGTESYGTGDGRPPTCLPGAARHRLPSVPLGSGRRYLCDVAPCRGTETYRDLPRHMKRCHAQVCPPLVLPASN